MLQLINITQPAFHRGIVLLLFFISSLPIYSEELPKGYQDFAFGKSMKEVQEVIRLSPEFETIREEILSIRTHPDAKIISVKGTGYISRAYFHFNNDKLYHIYLILNQNKIGYYNLLTSLTEKYGQPSKLVPNQAQWINEITRITIEKPASVRYTELPTWEELGNSKDNEQSIFETNRKNFLNLF